MDGTNVAQIAALDLNAAMFLGETFEHVGLGGVKWTLVPSDSKGFANARQQIFVKSPAGQQMSRQAMRSGLVGQALSSADQGIQQITEMVLGKNGDRNLDRAGAVKEIIAQWSKQRDAALDDVDKVLEELSVEDIWETQRQALIDAVADHLVVKIEKFPAHESKCENDHAWHAAQAECPECGGDSVSRKAKQISGGPELAKMAFSDPRVGIDILEDVMQACDDHSSEAKAALEEAAGN